MNTNYLVHIVSWGLAIAVAVIGGITSQNKGVEAQVDNLKLANVSVVERTAKLEANTENLQNDVKEIKNDVKIILGKLK